MNKYLLLALVAVCTFNLTSSLMAQRSHYDRHDGHYDRHNGHYDYHEEHYDRHDDNHRHDGYVRPRSSYYAPRTVYHPPATNVFGARSHTGALSAELGRHANSMCLEAHRHYRHNPAYTEIYRDMYKVKADAEHIASLTKDSSYSSVHGNDHIAADLRNIDQLFHRIQNGVRGWTPDNTYHQTLPTRLATVERSIHHLMKDYGVKSSVAGSSPQSFPQGSPQRSPQGSPPSAPQAPVRAGKSVVIQNDFGP